MGRGSCVSEMWDSFCLVRRNFSMLGSVTGDSVSARFPAAWICVTTGLKWRLQIASWRISTAPHRVSHLEWNCWFTSETYRKLITLGCREMLLCRFNSFDIFKNCLSYDGFFPHRYTMAPASQIIYYEYLLST